MQSLFPTDTDSGSYCLGKDKKILREIISGDEFLKWISPIIAKESGNQRNYIICSKHVILSGHS